MKRTRNIQENFLHFKNVLNRGSAKFDKSINQLRKKTTKNNKKNRLITSGGLTVISSRTPCFNHSYTTGLPQATLYQIKYKYMPQTLIYSPIANRLQTIWPRNKPMIQRDRGRQIDRKINRVEKNKCENMFTSNLRLIFSPMGMGWRAYLGSSGWDFTTILSPTPWFTKVEK